MQDPIPDNIQSKKKMRHSLSGKTSTRQAQDPEFKLL
jgi:hypothetical protein